MRHFSLKLISILRSQITIEILFSRLFLDLPRQRDLLRSIVFLIACGFLCATFSRVKLFVAFGWHDLHLLGDMGRRIRWFLAALVGLEQLLEE